MTAHQVKGGIAPDGNMLDPRAAIVVDILLDLRLLLARGRLVDWHLDLKREEFEITILLSRSHKVDILL